MFIKGTHYSQDLENAVLGACMLEKTATGRVYSLVLPEYFYQEKAKVVFVAIREMFDKNVPIDLLTVLDWLTKKGITEIAGTADKA